MPDVFVKGPVAYVQLDRLSDTEPLPTTLYPAGTDPNARTWAQSSIRGIQLASPGAGDTIVVVDHLGNTLTLTPTPGTTDPMLVQPAYIKATGTTVLASRLKVLVS